MTCKLSSGQGVKQGGPTAPAGNDNFEGGYRKMRFRWILVAWMAAAALLVACRGGDELAEVNGKEITRAQFDAYLKFKRLPVDSDKRRQALLDQYLEREALAGVIEKEGKLDKALIDAELNEFRKEMLISRYFERYLDEQVGDDAVRNYYNAHAADYQERKARVAHILFRVNPGMSETERKAKLTAAQEAYSRIKAGEDFAKVAESTSEDTISARKGGDLGWIKEGAIDPRFSETVFGMEAGAVSEPVKTAFGFHIIKLLEGPMVVKRPFEAVKGDIRYQLRNQAKAAELKRLLAESSIEKSD
jgi:peptidyl-prolyl cis-trans isomerase C